MRKGKVYTLCHTVETMIGRDDETGVEPDE